MYTWSQWIFFTWFYILYSYNFVHNCVLDSEEKNKYSLCGNTDHWVPLFFKLVPGNQSINQSGLLSSSQLLLNTTYYVQYTIHYLYVFPKSSVLNLHHRHPNRFLIDFKSIPTKGDLECKGAKKFTAMSCHPAGLFLVTNSGAKYWISDIGI